MDWRSQSHLLEGVETGQHLAATSARTESRKSFAAVGFVIVILAACLGSGWGNRQGFLRLVEVAWRVSMSSFGMMGSEKRMAMRYAFDHSA